MRAFKANRPTDKSLVGVLLTPDAMKKQENATLITATFPCTAQGLRWDFTVTNGHAGAEIGEWAIILLKESEAVGNIGIANQMDFYAPEQNVLAFGAISVGPNSGQDAIRHISGSTKTMRKLMAGDRLMFQCKTNTDSLTYRGIVQFFCKS